MRRCPLRNTENFLLPSGPAKAPLLLLHLFFLLSQLAWPVVAPSRTLPLSNKNFFSPQMRPEFFPLPSPSPRLALIVRSPLLTAGRSVVFFFSIFSVFFFCIALGPHRFSPPADFPGRVFLVVIFADSPFCGTPLPGKRLSPPPFVLVFFFSPEGVLCCFASSKFDPPTVCAESPFFFPCFPPTLTFVPTL